MFHKTFLILLFTFLFPKIYCNNQPSIVIIGAGASGIAAATRLLKNNFTNIKILEAEDRIGGRIHSVKFGDAYVDLGAEWCTDNDINIVYSLVKDLGILRATETKNLPVVAEGKHVDPNLIDQLIKFMVTVYKPGNRGPTIDKACKAENSYGKCFKKLFNSSFVSQYKNDNDIKMALASFTVLENLVTSIENALDWDDIAMYGTQYDENVQERRFNWNGLGFKTILDVLMQKYPTNQQALPIDEKLIFNKEVVSISNWKSKDKATKIKCRDGDIFTADHVLFTASLGVLKAKHDTLFDPALPLEKIDTIKNMGYGAIAKVAMRFAQRWWDEDSAFVIIWTPEDVEKLKQNFKRGVTKSGKQWLTYLTSILPAENNSKVMVAWYSRDIILELEQLSDEDLLEGHKYLIRQFLGKKYNVTDPDKILRSKWYTNPHFLGSYSYESTKGHATGGSDFQRKLAIPLFQEDGKPSILFAGEATNSKFFSTVHGAIETGYREADRVINLYKGLK